ncbi:MAG: hypothetical protein ABGZ53_00195 [Fuerstiella sp.]
MAHQDTHRSPTHRAAEFAAVLAHSLHTIDTNVIAKGGNMTTSLQDHRYLSCESVDDILVVKPAADPRNFSYEVK